MLLLEVLQEAEPGEIQVYRKTVRKLFEESDKLDAVAVKDARRNLKELQGNVADRLTRLQSEGKLTPMRLEEVNSELKQLTGSWTKSYAAGFREAFGPRAYEIGDRLATEGVGAAGLKMSFDRRSDMDMLHSVELDDSLAYRIGAEATQAAMKMVRMHAMAGRDWQTVLKELTRDPVTSIYWNSALKSSEAAARTWAAKAQADGSLRRLQELSDRTGGAVKMLFVLMDTSSGCKKCPPHAGKVYSVRGGQAPRLPLHPNCRCAYVPTYERPSESGQGLDPISPTPSPLKSKDFESIIGVQPSEKYLTKDARPILDSPFDAKGMNYAEDALQQPAPGIPRTRDYSRFAASLGPQMEAHDGKPVTWISGVESHVIGEHSQRESQRRVEWLEALPRLLKRPEFSGSPGPGKRLWLGRFRLGQVTMFCVAIAREGQSSYNLETFHTLRGLSQARRKIQEINGS